MHKILIPLDLSKPSQVALKTATHWAVHFKAELLLVHILPIADVVYIKATENDIRINSTFNNSYLLQIVEEARDKLLGIKNQLIGMENNVSILVTSGKIHQALSQITEEEDIDLIIMSTGGITKSDLFTGSVAAKVMNYCTCPLLSIRENEAQREIKKIVFACDLNEEQTVYTDLIRKVQQIHQAHIFLLYINTPYSFLPNDKLEKKFKEFAHNHKLKEYSTHIYCDYLQEDGILNFSKSVEADLITLVSHKRKGMDKFFKGSVSTGVIENAHIPVLTLEFR